MICSGDINMDKPLSKVAYFSRIAEIFSTGLAAQTVQNAKFSSTRILLMHDWVFRLGVSIYFETRYSAKYTKGQTVKVINAFFQEKMFCTCPSSLRTLQWSNTCWTRASTYTKSVMATFSVPRTRNRLEMTP